MKRFSLFSFVLILVAATNFAQAADVAFERYGTMSEINGTVVSEDGRRIGLLHTTEDLITIIDTATAAKVATIETTRPQHAIWRGDDLLVANGGKGTISIFDASKDYMLDNEIEVGQDDPICIAAPGGSFYDGNLIVTCKTGKDSRKLIGVNIKRDAAVEVGGGVYMSIATVSYDGKHYFHQGSLGHSPSAPIGGVSDFQALVKRNEKVELHRSGAAYMAFMYQVRKGPIWFGCRRIARGMPPEMIGDEDIAKILVGDRTAFCCYAFDTAGFKCIGLDGSLTEVGTKTATYPDEFKRLAANPPFISSYDMDANDRYQIAVTLDGKLHLYLYDHVGKNVFYTHADAFTMPPSVLAAASEASSSGASSVSGSSGGGEATSTVGRLPAKVQVGQKVTCQVSKIRAAFELMIAPDDAKLSDTGELTWTPTAADVGPQSFKIKQTVGRSIKFLRLQTEVIDLTDMTAGSDDGGPTIGTDIPASGGGTDLPGTGTVNLDNVGYHAVDEGKVAMRYGLGGRTILMISGSTLKVLDRSGLKVLKTHQFDTSYRVVMERPGYLVALAAKSVDIIDKNTLAVIKSHPVEYAEIGDIAIHSRMPLSYLSVKVPSADGAEDQHRVIIMSEKTGQTKRLEGVTGWWIEMAPNGLTLYTAIRELIDAGESWNPHARMYVKEYDHFDLVVASNLRTNPPTEVGANENPGMNGSGLVISHDGKYVSHIAGGGAPGNGYSIAALAAEEVEREVVRYQIEAFPRDIEYHPTANLTACTNGGQVWIFNRRTGEKLAAKLATSEFKDIQSIFFAPSGTRLMVAHSDPQRGRVVQAVALKLTDQEKADAAGPWPIATGGSTAAPTPPSNDPPAAADGGMRWWTDSTGKHRIQGQLLGVQGKNVMLRKPDGNILTFPGGRLSEADINYVESWLESRQGP